MHATAAPTITGTVEVGKTLKCSEGTWNEPVGQLTLKYQWLRDTETILGATSNEHKVESGDSKHLLYCQVTAKNSRSEEAHATSEPVGIPGPGAPTNTGLPTLVGSLSLGSTVTCKEGTWTHSPTQYVYQWLRDKVAIESARSSTYQIKVADQGHKLSCKVIAENSEGPSEPAESAEGHVEGEAPVQTSPTEVYSASEAPRVGESLTCLRGEWKGAPKPSIHLRMAARRRQSRDERGIHARQRRPGPHVQVQGHRHEQRSARRRVGRKPQQREGPGRRARTADRGADDLGRTDPELDADLLARELGRGARCRSNSNTSGS